jgi:hypothetical protein
VQEQAGESTHAGLGARRGAKAAIPVPGASGPLTGADTLDTQRHPLPRPSANARRKPGIRWIDYPGRVTLRAAYAPS